MSKRTIITYPNSLRDWHLHMPMPSHDRGDYRFISVLSTTEILHVQNRLYAMLESWRSLLEQHFGLSCRWSGMTLDQCMFSESSASQTQLIYQIKDETLSFCWSFDDAFIRRLLGFVFGLDAHESIQLVYSDMEQLFIKQVCADTMLPVINNLGVFCAEPTIQNGRREANALIGDQDTYYQFHFEMKVPSLKESVVTTLSFTESMLKRFIAFPMEAFQNQSKVTLNDEALRQIFTPVNATLGTVDLSLGELKDLQLGDVLLINRGLSDPVELRIAGELTFRGKLGTTQRRLSVQLIDHLTDIQKTGDDFQNIPDNSDDWFNAEEDTATSPEVDSVLGQSENESDDEFDLEKL